MGVLLSLVSIPFTTGNCDALESALSSALSYGSPLGFGPRIDWRILWEVTYKGSKFRPHSFAKEMQGLSLYYHNSDW